MKYRYRIGQIKLDLNETKADLAHKILKKIGRKDLIINDMQIVRESIDARNKDDIKMVYTVDFDVISKLNHKKPVSVAISPKTGVSEAPDMTYIDVPSGEKSLKGRPVIVGFGPCGMFAGLILARRGYRPIILERGRDVDNRVADVEKFWNDGNLNPDSNVQFGEGGAGTFSDGKLTTGIKDPRIRKVLLDFVKFGADSDILYKQKPHIGTDVLRTVVKNLRKEIISCGGDVRFESKFERLILDGDQVVGVVACKNGTEYEIPTENVVLAMGHSARDTFRTLFNQKVEMNQKPFSIGVRIEHPQEIIDKSQYGNAKGLPPADYKLSHHCENGRGVYTFCMCPGGEVVMAASVPNTVVTNGMSNRARNSGTANSALLVDVRCEDFPSESPLAGVDFQEKYEHLAFVNGGSNYKAPKTTWGEFKDDAESAQPVVNSLPEFAVDAMREAMPYLGKRLKGFDRDDAVLTAVESRSSSPVRFARDKEMEGTYKGFYPAGEGAGYAGGIMSAACDGIKVAEMIISKFKA